MRRTTLMTGWLATLALLSAGRGLAAEPLGTSFTYQGQLKEGGVPADGNYDFVFRLYDAETGGAQIGSDFPVDDKPVVDGLFTVQLDFGAGAFGGDARWIAIDVRDGGSGGAYTTLSPRQPVTGAPVATYALSGPGVTGLWEAVGNNIVNANTGFVGVGRSTPIIPSTEFFGVLTPTGDSAYGGMHIQTEGESGWPYYGYSTSGGIKAWTYFDTGADKWHLYAGGRRLTVERGTGNVGIGTDTPQAKLHVAGTAKMDGLQLTSSPSAGYVLTSDANGVGTWQPSGGGSGLWSANGDHIYNNNAGGVGIGTMDPASMLDVRSTEGVFGVMSEVPWIPVWAHRTSTSGTWPAMHGECDSEDPDGSAVRGIMTSSSSGLYSAGVLGVNSGSGYGVYGNSPEGTGVAGETDSDWHAGVHGINNGTGFGFGVYGVHYGSGWGACGISFDSTGVRGDTHADWYTAGVHGHTNGIFGYGVHGTTDAGGIGVYGSAPSGWGVCGESTDGTGVWGTTDSVSPNAMGVHGIVNSTSPGSSSAGVRGHNNGTGASGIGVYGSQDGSGYGVYGYTPDGRGVYGRSASGVGVYGRSETGVGVKGISYSADGYAGMFGDMSSPGKGLLVATESHLVGPVAIGAVSVPSGVMLRVNGTASVDVLEITGADLAEKFPVSEEIEPGTVVEIDPHIPGKLRMARGAYNRRVAGVASGAGDIPAGTILGNLPGLEDAPPVALSGRVWVKCDATETAIELGDLLTTSDTPGYAMAVRDFSRAHGAVIGKAMTPLARGQTGLVLVLVNLQ